MAFQAATMFAGDLFDAASRFAAETAEAGAAPEALRRAWEQAVQMGWPAMLVGEVHGGPGGTLADLAAVIEACARHALALPLVRRCAVVPATLAALGESAAPTLRKLASGDIDVDCADGSAVAVQALPSGGVRLSGTLEGLDLTVPATHRLMAAGAHLLLVPDAALPVPTTRHVGIDGRRQADIALAGLELPASAVLASGAAAEAAAAAGADLAALATAIEMTGTLGSGIERTIEYLLQRVQFGVALATFQALRHHVVELYVDYECASALLTRIALDSMARGHLEPRDAALAKLYLNQIGRRDAEALIQLHGGMGMTTELPAARLAMRLLVAQFEHGDRPQQLERLAGLARPLAGGAATAARAPAAREHAAS